MPGPRRKASTIVDVARVAGVSLPTVSRVLNDTVPVRPATRARVLAAMEELSYRPNSAARTLKSGQQSIVGVIAPDTVSYGRARMLAQIEERARSREYLVAVTYVEPDVVGKASSALDVLLGQSVVGVVVLDLNTYDAPALQARLGDVPWATVTNGLGLTIDVPHVMVDDRLAAADMTRHLLGLGHHTVHHVAVPGFGSDVHSRELGWRDALLEAGVPVPEPVMCDWTPASARLAGLRLAGDPSLTAVFCTNDEIALGVMRGLHEAGREVPRDVSVAGIDDQPLAQCWVPALTTYRMDFDWAGAAAFELLLDPLHGADRAGRPTSGIIVRESCSKPRP
ncbi:LacI family DNA-binding transcriptional regulator [Kineococcus sp. R86509]|uniref:LacI family DNA-binding transcriptional regulator n=1 Tax=Kineococcus sp. R86509 TaxID=3093851 RepID=UPI0036D28D9F